MDQPLSKTVESQDSKQLVDDVERMEENVFAIIESKIQFNEYRINNAASSFINLDHAEQGERKTPLEMKRIVFNNEHIIDLIRKYTSAINLLLVLRSKLKTENAYSVFSILKEDQFLKFSKHDLLMLMEGRPHQISA